MLDFTSAAYLGIRHPSASLKPWDRIALSKPAALAEPIDASTAAARLAELQQCGAASLATSTLHLLWDIGGLLPPTTQLFIDGGAYSVSRWGAERATARGIAIKQFRHFDPASLRDALRTSLRPGRIPVVLADGFCPACGRVSPLPDYVDSLRPFGGLIILDDTQALGIFGRPDSASPSAYGVGGGGTIRWHQLSSAAAKNVLIVASMAKAFDAPLAAISGDPETIRMFESVSRTRVHCSPPSIAAIRALSHALGVNHMSGDDRRVHLTRLVRRFRKHVLANGIHPIGGSFPVQSIRVPSGWRSLNFVGALRRRGIIAVPTRAAEAPHTRISFLFNADHKPGDIDELAHAVIHLAQLHSVQSTSVHDYE